MFINIIYNKLHVYIVEKNCPIFSKKFRDLTVDVLCLSSTLALRGLTAFYNRQRGVANFIGCRGFSRISSKIANLSKLDKLYQHIVLYKLSKLSFSSFKPMRLVDRQQHDNKQLVRIEAAKLLVYS